MELSNTLIESTNGFDICRTCLTDDDGKMQSLFSTYEESSMLVTEILQCFLPLKFEQNDGLPSSICSACVEEANKAYSFKLKCELADITLRKRINIKTEHEYYPNTDSEPIVDLKIKEENGSSGIFDDDHDFKDDDSDDSFNEVLAKTKRKSLKNGLNAKKKKGKLKREMIKIKKPPRKTIKSTFIESFVDGVIIYKCSNCTYTTRNVKKLGKHHKNHFGTKPFHCDTCDFKSNFNASLQAHLRIHTGEKPFLCDKCDLRFKQLSHLTQHRLTHATERPWPCAYCPYRAKQKRHLDNHVRTHSGEKPYMCDLCSFKCANHVNLLSHKRSHSDDKLFSCEQCNYKSNFKKNLLMHVVKHTGVKAFLCDTCDYKGTCLQNLKAHLVSHSQEKPFACNFCTYRTKTNSMLTKHLKTHAK